MFGQPWILQIISKALLQPDLWKSSFLTQIEASLPLPTSPSTPHHHPPCAGNYGQILVVFFDLVFCIAIWTYWFVVYRSISQRRNIQTYFLKNLFSGGKQQTFYFILLSITFMHISNNNFHSVFLLNW